MRSSAYWVHISYMFSSNFILNFNIIVSYNCCYGVAGLTSYLHNLFCFDQSQICKDPFNFNWAFVTTSTRRKPNIDFFSILLTNKGSHREVYRDFQPSLTSSAGGAKGCSEHRFRAPPAYTAQLPTLHQRRANNQYRTANQIYPTLRASSSTQATLEQSPVQVLTEVNVA